MIHIRSKREIELIANSCKIVVQALDMVAKLIEPGVTTRELDNEVARFINTKGARAAFKGYKGFPASCCISVGAEVVHGIPGNRRLQSGEIVSVDVGVECEGFFGDSAKTYQVGQIEPDIQNLLDVTLDALNIGVQEVRTGVRLSNVSHAIQNRVEGAGFSVVRELVGHGIGRKLHEDPQIPNYGRPDTGPRLKSGMVLAIEPMVNMGTHEVETLDDNWTVVTLDRRPSAHFEHTVVVTENGPQILTLS